MVGNQKRWEKRRKEKEMDEEERVVEVAEEGEEEVSISPQRVERKKGFFFHQEKEGKPSDAGVTGMLQQIGSLELFPA